MAICKKCRKSVGCGCNLLDGLCESCRFVQEVSKPAQTTEPTVIKGMATIVNVSL